MSKKKKHPPRSPRSIARSTPRRLTAGLDQVDSLVQRKRWTDAYRVLIDLDRRFPNNPHILSDLVNVCYELHELAEYQYACEQLLKVDPDNAEAALGLAGAYLSNYRPMLGLRAFQHFLQQWPDHPRAAEARQTVADLEAKMDSLLADQRLHGEEGRQIAILHEEMQSYLSQNELAQVRRVGEELLRRKPDFVPALNNISLAHFAEGDVEQAIAAAQQVLNIEPDNIHALANLVRFRCVTGEWAEARRLAKPLKASTARAFDPYLKKIEALSYLADDQGVIEVFDQAERSSEWKLANPSPYLYHLVAVAEQRSGRETPARQHWDRALQVSPTFDLAQDNLADCRKPIGERSGAWPYTFAHWLKPGTLADFGRMVERLPSHASNQAMGQAIQRFMQQHSEVVSLVPVLLERGDPAGREFAVRIARVALTPELLAALKDFALGRSGPDALRHEAAQVVSEAGLLSPGSVRLWMQGEWRDVLLMNWEIYVEPAPRQYAPGVERLLTKAIKAIQEDDDAERGEELLKQAMAIEPDAPDILNNLAAAYNRQGRDTEAESIIRRIHERHPDYFFGRTNVAQFCIRDGQLEQADELLRPLMALKRLHTSEFRALACAQIELCLARKQTDGARSWFDMLESIDPDEPMLELYRFRVYKPNIRELLSRRPRR